MTAISTALSGLAAAQARLGATASNLANMSTTGPLPSRSAGASGQAQAYQPIDTVEISGSGGEVRTTYRLRTPSAGAAYEPDSPYVDGNGLVATPDVDPISETVNEIASLRLAQLSADVIRVASRVAQSTINIFA